MEFAARRSQVDAPIELVIAIIILLASLSIALLIFGNTSRQQCFSEVKGEVQKLQLAMQDLALQSPPSTRRVYFKMPTCEGTSVDVLRFAYYSRADYCRACPGHFAGCWKLELWSFNPRSEAYEQSTDLYESGVCVDIAGGMILNDESRDNDACNKLSNLPCPYGVSEAECTPEVSGVQKSIFDPANVSSPARFQTLGRGARLYEITLRKGIGDCPGGVGRCAAISICADPLEG